MNKEQQFRNYLTDKLVDEDTIFCTPNNKQQNKAVIECLDMFNKLFPIPCDAVFYVSHKDVLTNDIDLADRHIEGSINEGILRAKTLRPNNEFYAQPVGTGGQFVICTKINEI
jgi:hypothetical protein